MMDYIPTWFIWTFGPSIALAWLAALIGPPMLQDYLARRRRRNKK